MSYKNISIVNVQLSLGGDQCCRIRSRILIRSRSQNLFKSRIRIRSRIRKNHFGSTTLFFRSSKPWIWIVFSLKCWIRLRSNEYGSETLGADPHLNVTDPDTTENEGPTWEAWQPVRKLLRWGDSTIESSSWMLTRSRSFSRGRCKI